MKDIRRNFGYSFPWPSLLLVATGARKELSARTFACIGSLTHTVLAVVLALHTIAAEASSGKETPAATSLSAIREAVRANEAKASLIKMEYRTSVETRGDVPSEILSARARTRPEQDGRPRHTECLYAQDGERVHSTVSYYADNEWIQGMVDVLDGQVHKHGRLPDLMSGRIDRVETFGWLTVAPTGMGFRPFANQYRLSELLVPAYGSVRPDPATTDGRDTVVVEVKRPNRPTFSSLIWIDLQRGMPLRIEHYGPHKNGAERSRAGAVEDIKLHQLPNGGWIPVQATK
jgi:hypothetical protein